MLDRCPLIIAAQYFIILLVSFKSGSFWSCLQKHGWGTTTLADRLKNHVALQLDMACMGSRVSTEYWVQQIMRITNPCPRVWDHFFPYRIAASCVLVGFSMAGCLSRWSCTTALLVVAEHSILPATGPYGPESQLRFAAGKLSDLGCWGHPSGPWKPAGLIACHKVSWGRGKLYFSQLGSRDGPPTSSTSLKND